MANTAANVPSVLALLAPIMSQTVSDMVELEDHAYAFHAKGTPGAINSLGARVTIKTAVAPNYGNQAVDGGTFREPGSPNYQQFLIPIAADNISGGINGAALTDLMGPNSFGGQTLGERLAENVKFLKKQRDIDFCRGSFPLGARAIVQSVTSTSSGAAGSVIVLDPVDGNRLLEPGAFYIIVNPTTGAAHGVSTGHDVFLDNAFPDNVTVNVHGDTSVGTAVTANDVFVNRADATGASSWNSTAYGFEYFFLDSGDYFGLSKDRTQRLRGIRENAFNNNVSRSLLLRGEVRYKYRWNNSSDDKLDAMVDFVPFAQEAIYKTLGYDLIQYMIPSGGPLEKFNGYIRQVSDGSRLMMKDGNLRNSNWFRYDPSQMERFEFEPTKIWDRDSLKYRTVTSAGVAALSGVAASPGQISDGISWVIQGKENMFYRMPPRAIWYYNLTSYGSPTSAFG